MKWTRQGLQRCLRKCLEVRPSWPGPRWPSSSRSGSRSNSSPSLREVQLAEISTSPSGDKRGEVGGRLWAGSMTAITLLLVGVVVYTSAHWGFHPPSQVETIDSTSLHEGGEFSEANLGTVIAPDGSAVVRVVAKQSGFVPDCLVVPAGKPVTIRLASADVVHGFLVQGTNVNAMVVPGYVTTVHTMFKDPGER